MSRSLPSDTRARHARLLAQALANIDAHLDEALTADRLADRAAMSRHHFHRVFGALMGCSVGSYVTARRLRRACALLASGNEPVLEIALAVGFESAQALAKALRRELGCSPGDVRRGHRIDAARWPDAAPPLPDPPQETTAMTPNRFIHLDDETTLVALTATARGMVGRSLKRAAERAFAELFEAIDRAGERAAVRSCIALAPDDPRGADDPDCRYIAGVLFGHDMATRSGEPLQPDIALSGSLAWTPIAPGRYAVFSHIGPYQTLHRSWDAIYRDWLPASGQTLRDVPPLELCLITPDRAPPDKLHTEIWIPLA